MYGSIRFRSYASMKSLLLVALLVPSLLAPILPASSAGIALTRVEYNNSQLRVEGVGAKPNTAILVNNIQLGVSDSAGAFRIQKDQFKSYNCQITVTDGLTSAQATLSNCTPTSPPPVLLSPANGAQTFLPIVFDWTDVQGAIGYDIEFSQSSSFLNAYPLFVYSSEYVYRSLYDGVWFWRVRTYQPSTTPGTYAVSEWTPAWSFNIPSTPPRIVEASIIYPVIASGELNAVYVQLTNVAPAGGKPVSLSSASAHATLPASFSIPEGYAFYGATISTGHVVANTTVTVTATVDAESRSASFKLTPEYLETIYLFPYYYSTSGWAYGGDTISLDVDLKGTAPPGGVEVLLSSSKPSIIPVPASVTIAPGYSSAGVFTTTAIVPVVTWVDITATYKTLTRRFTVIVSNATITSFTLNSASVTGGNTFTGNLAIAGPNNPECGWVTIWSDQPGIVSVGSPAWLCGSLLTTFYTNQVSTTTTVNVFAKLLEADFGVTRSASIIVSAAPAALDSVSVNRAEYDQSKKQLLVEATSTRNTATLKVYNFTTGELIGTLTNQGGGKYSGTFSLSVNPWKIKVVSSLGGTATATVTAK